VAAVAAEPELVAVDGDEEDETDEEPDDDDAVAAALLPPPLAACSSRFKVELRLVVRELSPAAGVLFEAFEMLGSRVAFAPEEEPEPPVSLEEVDDAAPEPVPPAPEAAPLTLSVDGLEDDDEDEGAFLVFILLQKALRPFLISLRMPPEAALIHSTRSFCFVLPKPSPTIRT